MTNKREALSQSVYDYLLDQIMSGQLKPGDRIPETLVAESYGISRTPVRDAMRRLDNEGIIQIFPKRFAQVSEFTETDIQEVGFMRVTLDQMAMRMAMRFGNFDSFDSLEKIAQECLEALRAGDRIRRNSLDAQFHMSLAAISNNKLLLKFQEEINVRVRFILTYYRSGFESEEHHLTQHLEMVDALRKHDEARALDLVHQHLDKFYNL